MSGIVPNMEEVGKAINELTVEEVREMQKTILRVANALEEIGKDLKSLVKAADLPRR